MEIYGKEHKDFLDGLKIGDKVAILMSDGWTSVSTGIVKRFTNRSRI